MELVVHVDGGARGNPGPAGAGVVVRTVAGEAIHEAGYFLGSQTNNVAEYVALIRALERIGSVPATSVTIHSDSELLVRQLTGDYQVKAPNLKVLYEQVQRLLLRLPRWQIRHVRREQNRRADELANLAMDEKRDVIIVDADRAAKPAAPAVLPAAPQDEDQPPPPRPKSPSNPVITSGGGKLSIQLSVATPPGKGGCEAEAHQQGARVIGATLPQGLCVFAASAILPTVIAMLSTDAGEMRAIPTLTVRCSKQGCGAVFTLTPVVDENGSAHGGR